MRRFISFKSSARGLLALLAVSAATMGFVAFATSAASANDCDVNAVVYCGANSAGTLISRYDNGDGHNSAAAIQRIYSHFGISSSDIHAMGADSHMGSVTSSGNVFLNGNLVATGVTTAGRKPDTTFSCGNQGPETFFDIQGTKFYTRHPSASFCSSSLSALVVMKNGVFQFAILTSCGNPVTGHPNMPPPPKPTPKPTPVPTPKPQPKTVIKPTPVNVCSGNTANANSGIASQGGNCSINTTVVQTTSSNSGSCSSLQLSIDPNNPLNVTATVSFQTQGDSQLQSIIYDFGDGVAIPPTTAQTMTHSYQQGGTYVIKATLNFSGSSASSPSVCQSTITVMQAQPTCDSLTVTSGDNQLATITQFQTTANGGTFTGADINWGDGTTATAVNPVVGQAHQYANPGTYTIDVVPHFTVNGQDVTAAGPNCQQQVTFTSPTPPATTTSSTTPTTPASLVNTGAGSVIAVFGIAAIAGTFGYRYFLRRHLSDR